MRVSYNGYYVSFPRKRREFDSLHPHQKGARSACVHCGFLKWGRERKSSLHPHQQDKRNSIWHRFGAFLGGIFAVLGVVLAPIGMVSAMETPVVDLASPRLIIYNLNDDRVLYEKDADVSVPVASLTKIMTAVLVLENNFQPGQKITVTSDMVSGLNEFAVVGLSVGRQITIDELMYALMLPSAGDAAQALAINDSGSISAFADKMNQKASSLGLTHTHFSNPVGFDQNNYSSARDLAILTKHALTVPNFRTYFEANEQYLPSLGKTVTKTVRDTAKKYGFDSSVIVGAKTGFTNAAGLNLSSTTSLNGVNYLMVNLNAPAGTADHILDAMKLYNYYDTNYAYRVAKAQGEGIKELPVRDSFQSSYTVVAPEEIKVFVRKDLDLMKLQYNYSGVEEIARGTNAGDKLGEVTVTLDGEQLATFPVKLEQEIIFFHYELWIGAVVIGVGVVVVVVVLRRRRRGRC